jgi:hypothetical protein
VVQVIDEHCALKSVIIPAKLELNVVDPVTSAIEIVADV